jgi:hypothetical protein
MRTFVRLVLHPLNGLNDWNGLQFKVDGAAGA